MKIVYQVIELGGETLIIGLQVGLCICLLVIATAAALYEGSPVLIYTTSWEHSTPFTRMIHGEVTGANDIVIFDLLVYASQFAPLFPIVMLLSATYLIILATYMFLRNKEKFPAFLFGFATVLIILGVILLLDADTQGGKAIFTALLISGISCLSIGYAFKKSPWKPQMEV
ncbi:DUF4306 domain-containing protein [Oceanobacillus jeddahense]|uniref:DUF4306 domain-containing protein n=1 Tax=Oceanobacillus jeddahense TaxID=1462527 RepID=UPI0009DCDC71|nr:DUF4306 domain-containing protein [Oceanobacillus jeddahense]